MTIKEFSNCCKDKVNLEELSKSILFLEQELMESSETEKKINSLFNFLEKLFSYINAEKVDVLKTGALEYLLLNIRTYDAPAEMSKDSFLYVLRTSLRDLYSEKNVESNLYHMVLHSMVYIDLSNLSIDAILNKSKCLPNPTEAKRTKKKVK